MVGITLSPEQIRTAPPEVRRWLEQELLATFGLQSPTAELDSPQLATLSVDEATTVLSLIQDMLPAVNVFFELGREGKSVETNGIVAFRLADILQHTPLQTLEQVITCLDTIGEVVRRLPGHADAAFYGLDSRGHSFISAQTQRSILHVRQQIIAARNLDVSRATIGMPGVVGPVISPSVALAAAPSCPIWSAPSRTPNGGAPDRSTPDVALGNVSP
jgi:hypothetical protein